MTATTSGTSPLADWAMDHLACGRDLVERHVPEPQERARLLGLLDAAAPRIRDTRLRLAVVGEFSSGKSTLINALLGGGLLPAGALPTTGAATWVTASRGTPGYSFRLDGSAHHIVPLDGRPLAPEVLSSLRNTAPDAEPSADGAVLLGELVSEGPWCDRIDQLTVSGCAPLLDQGAVLIDTPGSNSPVAEHVRVTQQVMAEEADAAVVVVSSHVLVTDSLVRFLQDAVPAQVRGRCVFVITRMDDLDGDDEYASVLRAVRTCVERKLSIRNPVVLGAAPAGVTKRLAGRSLTTAAAHWYERFPELEGALGRFVIEQRPARVPLRVLSSLDEALALVEDALARRHRDLEAAYADLTARPVRELDDFLSPRAEPVRTVTRQVSQAAQAVRRDVAMACDATFGEAAISLVTSVYACRSRTELATRLGAAAHTVEKTVMALSEQLTDDIGRQVSDAAAGAVRLLDEAFTAEYADVLPVPVPPVGQEPNAIEAPGTPPGGRVHGARLSSSAVLGALAGNEFLGKSAALVLAGFPLFPSLDRLREEVLTSLAGWLESVHEEVRADARRLTDVAVARLEQYICDLVEAYRAAHTGTVTHLLSDRAEAYRRMGKEGAAVAKGMATVRQRRLLVRTHLTRLDVPREPHE
ncbi:dynamin family protein [Streptomyces sp. NPDC058676]|uniref:dynamin family protein n=1 Tax=unclassified Streptomyces TaxID=2593676 RepID=UPI003654ECD4